MTDNERVRTLRKTLGLTLEKFGERLGLKKNTVSAIETGRNTLTEQNIKSICREFNVDYIWLTTGEGQMFLDNDDDTVEMIDRVMFGESVFHKNLFKTFANLDETELTVLEGIINKYIHIANNQNEKADD